MIRFIWIFIIAVFISPALTMEQKGIELEDGTVLHLRNFIVENSRITDPMYNQLGKCAYIGDENKRNEQWDSKRKELKDKLAELPDPVNTFEIEPHDLLVLKERTNFTLSAKHSSWYGTGKAVAHAIRNGYFSKIEIFDISKCVVVNFCDLNEIIEAFCSTGLTHVHTLNLNHDSSYNKEYIALRQKSVLNIFRAIQEGGLPALEELKVSNSGITPECTTLLLENAKADKLNKLKVLDLSGCVFKDEQMEKICNVLTQYFTSLQEIRFTWVQLEELGIERLIRTAAQSPRNLKVYLGDLELEDLGEEPFGPDLKDLAVKTIKEGKLFFS